MQNPVFPVDHRFNPKQPTGINHSSDLSRQLPAFLQRHQQIKNLLDRCRQMRQDEEKQNEIEQPKPICSRIQVEENIDKKFNELTLEEIETYNLLEQLLEEQLKHDEYITFMKTIQQDDIKQLQQIEILKQNQQYEQEQHEIVSRELEKYANLEEDECTQSNQTEKNKSTFKQVMFD